MVILSKASGLQLFNHVTWFLKSYSDNWGQVTFLAFNLPLFSLIWYIQIQSVLIIKDLFSLNKLQLRTLIVKHVPQWNHTTWENNERTLLQIFSYNYYDHILLPFSDLSANVSWFQLEI